MKKLILLCCASIAVIYSLEADTETVDGYTWTYSINYSIQNNTASISGISPNPNGEITIPSMLGGCPVTSIGFSTFYGCSGLTSITIPDRVTSISSFAFYYCSGLTSVTIPDNVTSIGSSAFSGCSGLKDVRIPQYVCSRKLSDIFPSSYQAITNVVISDSVTSIGSSAFSGCSGLTSVTIPNSMTSIGYNAFSGCSGLTSITIPGSVTSIDSSAFTRCSGLKNIQIPQCVCDTLLLYIFPSSYQAITNVVISDSVTSIVCNTFSGCSGLTGVTIPDSVTNIGRSAFYDCSSLTSVAIPNSVTSIGDCAFYNCSSLTSIVIPDSVTSIGRLAFSGCSGLKVVQIPQCICASRLSDIFPNSYQAITNVVICDGVTDIGSSAFSGCNNLTHVAIPGTVASIGDNAFLGCTSLETVSIPQCVCVSRLSSVFPGDYRSIANVIIDEGVTAVGDHLFEGCSSLTSITIPDSVTSFGNCVFAGCDALENISIGSGVMDIGQGAFKDCDSLTDIEVADGNPCFSRQQVAGGWILLSTDGGRLLTVSRELAGLAIPDGVTTIDQYALSGCASLEEVVFPDGLHTVGKGAFDRCDNLSRMTLPTTVTRLGDIDLREIDVVGSQTVNGFRTWNGWILGCDDETVARIEIPDGMVGIAPYALADFWDLEEVVLPESLKYIGYGAFMNDTFLDGVVIPDGVEYIDGEAFKNCTYLRDIAIGEGVCEIGDEAFANCTQITTLSIPDEVGSIGRCAFSNCWRMLSVKLPLGLAHVGTDMFARCTSLVGVSVPSARFTMAEIFGDVSSQLTSAVVIPGETEVCSNAFAGCSALASLTFPDGITNVQNAAFRNCSSLVSVALPGTVESLGDQAFYGCSSLAAIVLPDSVRTIGNESFRNCSSLKNVALSRNLGALPDYAFHGCSRLTSMIVPASVRNLGGQVGNCITALYFLGNAPAYDVDAYASMPSSMTTYVVQGSRGWDGIASSRDLPEKWIGRDITFWTPNRFNATFDANGGKFSNEAGTYACEEITDTNYAIPPFEPTRTGYAFAGWWTDASEGAQIKATTPVNETRDTTFYAHWTLVNVPVTVRFNANGGTVSPDEATYYAGLTYETFPVPTKEHYVFGGWYTSAVGGEKINESSEVPVAGAELFAHWVPATYSIRYNANGGSGYMPDQSFTYGADVTLMANSYHKPNCSFIGWGISAGGPVVYADKKTISTLGAVQGGVIMLYAQWVASRYAVRYDSNGGIGSMDSDTFTNGVEQALSSNVFTRTGYVFIGWSKTADGGVDYADGERVKDILATADGAVSLFVVWARDTSNVKFTFGGDKPWIPARFARNGEVVWQSGEIGDTQTSMMEARVFGYGTVAFDWQPSCEDSFRGMRLDYLTFSVDGVEKAFVDGTSEWATVSCTIQEPGEHVLRWQYVKDSAGKDYGDCGRVTAVTWSPNLNTLAEFVNAGGMNFTTTGDAPWAGQTAVAHDGIAALRSGAISDGESSRLEYTVSGAGELRFWWKVSSEEPFRGIPLDYVAFSVDGVRKEWIAGETDWTNVTVSVEGDGQHVLAWVYQKDDWEDTSAGEDCAWLDEVTWTPANVAADIGGGKSVTVPGTWIAAHENLVRNNGGSVSAALASTAANGRMSVAECYVVGIDPESTTNDFKITSFPLKADGTPDLENIVFDPPEARWNVPGARPVVKGAMALGDEWLPVTDENKASFRFFKVEVEMP